jgi:hypothetical protein
VTVDPLEGIDGVLAGWDERLRRMSDNLVALEGDPNYQLLASGGRRDTLVGLTRERALPVLEGVTDLFQHRERLGDLVARAKAVRASISTLSFWDKDAKIAEIKRLLVEPSIELARTEAPLSQRGLLDASYQPVTIAPEALLARMVELFSAARAVVSEVGHAWTTLESKLAVMERDLAALRAAAAEIGGDASTSVLEQAQREMVELGAQVARDPLGVERSLGAALLPRMAGLRARIDAERGARDRAEATLLRAADVRRDLAAGHEAALRAVEEASRTIDGGAGALLPAVEGSFLEGLDAWREKLASTVRARRWQGAEVGLARWMEAALGYRETDRAAQAKAEGLLAQRSELAGRLSARRAQAAALAARGTLPPPSLEAHAHEADRLLRTAQVDLAAATAAVEAYEAEVVGLAGRSRR